VPDAGPPGFTLVVGAAVDDELAGAEVELEAVEELEPLLEQAVIAAVSTKPSAGARKTRWNPMTYASLGRR
jgi:hypothetical protein